MDTIRAERRYDGPRHIVLLGASVGGAWNIPGLPERVGNTDYRIEYVCEYSADKSGKLADILGRAENRPDAVILKECSAYFPGEAARLKTLVPAWVKACRDGGVVPILATVVPVVRSFPLRVFLLGLLRGKWNYPGGTFESVIEFNDWVRNYAAGEGLVVLDLEEAVRTSPSDRHLSGKYAQTDGLHINEEAYRQLDVIVIPALEKVEFNETKKSVE